MMANIRSDTLQMLFMEIIKKKGPKTEPCITAHSITLVSDHIPS